MTRPCEDFPHCSPPTKGNFTEYLNNKAVLSQLGFSEDFVYRRSNSDAGLAIAESLDNSLPTTRHIVSILEATSRYKHMQDKDGIKLLVLNGNEDGLCNTPGQKWVYENLSWRGAAGYRAATWKSLTAAGIKNGKGEWKASEDGKLAFVAMDGAGHMVPLDQPEVAAQIIQKWIST